LWTDLTIKGLQFANIPEVLYRYRQWEKQVTNIQKQGMWQSVLKIRKEYAEYVIRQIVKQEERFSDFFESIIELLNQSLISIDQVSGIVYQIYFNEPAIWKRI
jgi:hypothetical protein